MKRLEYVKPNAEIIRFDNSDVVTTSGTGGGGGCTDFVSGFIKPVTCGLIVWNDNYSVYGSDPWGAPDDGPWGGGSQNDGGIW